MTARASYKKSEVSRRSVVEAAVRALANQGFAHTSVSDIAHSAGMSKGVVHYHFANKDDLIARVLEHCSMVVATRTREAWELGGTPTERIRRALREAWQMRREGIPEIRVIMDLMAQAVHEPHLRGAVRSMMHAIRNQIIQDLIGSLETLGLRPKVSPCVITRMLMAALDGLCLQQLFDPSEPEEEEELLRAVEVVAFSLFQL
ncbi:TetR/AcrR family transcriptional regulator [Pendulispora albinea]|uniref:TetR/AcrR family transcriptional regulator n=1 Tax=Pendulispora albinea TaxID=2741071 RepID=A0ABZ2LNA6_9BACT